MGRFATAYSELDELQWLSITSNAAGKDAIRQNRNATAMSMARRRGWCGWVWMGVDGMSMDSLDGVVAVVCGCG